MKTRRILILILAIGILFQCSFYSDALQPRASDQIVYYNTAMEPSGNGNLDISFSIRCTCTMDVLGATSIVVQRYTGTSWLSEFTYNIRDYPTMQTTGKSYYGLLISYSPRYRNAKYRAQVFFYARNSSGLDTRIGMSNTVST